MADEKKFLHDVKEREKLLRNVCIRVIAEFGRKSKGKYDAHVTYDELVYGHEKQPEGAAFQAEIREKKLFGHNTLATLNFSNKLKTGKSQLGGRFGNVPFRTFTNEFIDVNEYKFKVNVSDLRKQYICTAFLNELSSLKAFGNIQLLEHEIKKFL